MNNDLDLHCSAGPVSSMPGSAHSFPAGAMCDHHADRLAVKRVQGETDSFGCEYVLMCSECYDQYREYQNSEEARTGTCDWCKRHATDLSNRRDVDEGMAGPMYRVCGACCKKDNLALAEALDRYHSENDDYDYGDDDSDLGVEDYPPDEDQIYADLDRTTYPEVLLWDMVRLRPDAIDVNLMRKWPEAEGLTYEVARVVEGVATLNAQGASFPLGDFEFKHLQVVERQAHETFYPGALLARTFPVLLQP